MKNLIIVSLFFVLYFGISNAQTNANIPGPENVLVVYNANYDTSLMVANHYRNARNIPSINIVELNLPDSIEISYGGSNHLVGLRQQGEIIMDITNEYSCLATIHSWVYFNDYIVKPISNHLKTTVVNGDTLKNIINFIVLC